MLSSAIGRIVGGCLRYRYTIIALSLVIAVLSGYYAATHFAINTDINKLISPNLDWRKQELSFAALFPGPFETGCPGSVGVDAETVQRFRFVSFRQ